MWALKFVMSFKLVLNLKLCPPLEVDAPVDSMQLGRFDREEKSPLKKDYICK